LPSSVMVFVNSKTDKVDDDVIQELTHMAVDTSTENLLCNKMSTT